MKNILILCTGNTCRSVMAVYAANNIALKKNLPYNFKGAGIMALDGAGASENSIAALKEIGIDAENHTATHVSKVNLDSFDEIHVMTENHKTAIVSQYGEKYIGIIKVLNVPDPFMRPLEDYLDCLNFFTRFYGEFII